MRCETARQWISQVLDELLTNEQRKALEGHLKECVSCRAEWRLLRTVQKVLASTKPAPIPYDLTPIVMERIKAVERERQSRWRLPLFRPVWRWLAVATAPIALIALLVGIKLWQEPPPPSESLYWSAHIAGAASVTTSPELTPVSIALSGIYFAGDE